MSLELPEGPIPLIDSQAGKRKRAEKKNLQKEDVNAECLNIIPDVEQDKSKEICTTNDEPMREDRGSIESDSNKSNEIKDEGSSGLVASSDAVACLDDCLCSDISKNLRINIRKKPEATKSAPNLSPEVTQKIHIAMKYRDQQESGLPEDVEEGGHSTDESNRGVSRMKKIVEGQQDADKDGTSPDVHVDLDLTLNCNSVQLSSRDVSVRALTKRRASAESAR